MNSKIPPISADAQQSSEKLSVLISQEITAANKPMPFSRFMELALYAPQYGYYTGGSHKIGADGDFVTAPVLTPLFGKTLAVQLNALLPQTAGNLYEFGAGTGDLAATLVQNLSDGLNRYYIIELSPELAERQRALIAQKLPSELFKKVIHLNTLPESFDGIIIGNEVLDAMPVELVCRENGGFRQICVGLKNGGFIQTKQPLTHPGLSTAAENYFPAVEPYTSELHPQQHAFTATLAAKLTRGGIIFIDYGFDAAQYYHPKRSGGTLIGHHRHRTVHDPFFRIGLTDLTAHVNFTDIAQAGTDGGLDLIGYATQSSFLLNLGITDLLAQAGDSASPAYLRAAAAVQQLINPHEMGELFKAIAFGRNIDVDWQGFITGDICHKL
ncbi:class I SAM-dependent methyltransferase [Neisseria chenwenguii]|uniref:S-adenosyl-L-methionine-dependent methyltransferase n=1 Tax=Neisseria chenwenguii TaxID=1853278 RepID=A0A220S2G8_9NEIS|nr:SAM-dependent methyltransferase [Neisseria chenwenguii]ASK27576.1 S-adenosyl-L-methionine-dependent methyltransferase [Neisseria chenwenguii]ROV55537.1 class I SAM-dependent methyltransferase [Neisseria chenwenguii]